MAVIGYMFTGAGYQYVGLGKKAYDSTWSMRQYYDKVEKNYPDFKINKLSFLGPESELSAEENGLIINAVYQRGIFDVLKDYKVTPEQMMGYKSGELMALACAGALSFDDAMNFLFKKRELVLEEVGREFFHHMLVNSLDIQQADKIIEGFKGKADVHAAAYNGKDSCIIACETKAAAAVESLLKKLSAAVIHLPNEEFACMPVLKPIADRLKEEFVKISMDKPVNRVICQTTGEYYESVKEIREKFTDYIWKPSLIGASLEAMLKNGVNTFVETGPGTFLSRMSRKHDSSKRSLNTNDLGELQKTVKLAN
ncbi:MAG TPA: ACP S-malonyltransferase [bacterium]|nr:ACP S-malonyltransferase [bacterium]